ncbi:unnamed protein product, partial [Rotaria sp. Silwood2]
INISSSIISNDDISIRQDNYRLNSLLSSNTTNRLSLPNVDYIQQLKREVDKLKRELIHTQESHRQKMEQLVKEEQDIRNENLMVDTIVSEKKLDNCTSAADVSPPSIIMLDQQHPQTSSPPINNSNNNTNNNNNNVNNNAYSVNINNNINDLIQNLIENNNLIKNLINNQNNMLLNILDELRTMNTRRDT